MKMSLPRHARSLLRLFLCQVASGVCSTTPLRRVPGWWSGYTLGARPDARRRLRRLIWGALLGETVRVNWYYGIRLDLRMGTDISALVFLGGEIDPNEFSFLAEFLRPGMFVVDIGANEGLYSLFCRQRVGAAGRVIAIEPSGRELEHLRRNLRLNHFNDIEVVPVALGDRTGQVTLTVAEIGHAGHNALGSLAAPWVRVCGEMKVPMQTLDALAQERGWPRVDLIKVDIEGSEFAAVRGGEQLLLRDHPVLLFEAEAESLELRHSRLSDLLMWIRGRGYMVMDFSGGDGTPVPLGRRQPRSANLLAVPEDGPLPKGASLGYS
jgi:FkbM family methyltransferase